MIQKDEVLIMANKITKREVINAMLKDVNVAGNEMYVAFLQNELKLLDKKAEKRGKSEDELKQIAHNKDLVLNALALIGSGTVSEIQKANSELSALSNQKVTAILKALGVDGLVVRNVEGRKTVFSLKAE